MKKQQKNKQEKQPLPKKKQSITFEERFKDKKNVVSKLGVLDLLGLQQPFDLERPPTPTIQESIVNSRIQKIQQQLKGKEKVGKQKLNQTEKNRVLSDLKVKTSKTDQLRILRKEQKKQEGKRKNELPKISKSSINLVQVTKEGEKKRKQVSTKQYWRKSTIDNGQSFKKRANSQLSCISIVKADQQANSHFENLLRFQKISTSKKKTLKIQRV